MVVNALKTKRGDSTDIVEITIDGVPDLTGYVGKCQILKGRTKAFGPLIIGPTDGVFKVALMPAQTETLEEGEYTVVFEIEKLEVDVVVFRREVSWPLVITESLLNS